MLDQARTLLTEALQRISDKKLHISLIEKFSIYEFKYGNADRARAMFDSLLVNYPKRIDLLNVYIDQEIRLCKLYHDTKHNDMIKQINITRSLLDKSISMSYNTKKIKFLFKKYLNFEKLYGTSQQQDIVKQKAREYVQRKLQS